jgi:hypothetical protein
MQEIEQSVDALRRTLTGMSRGLKLQTEAELMGGFGTTIRDLETGELWMSEGTHKILGIRRLSAVSPKSPEEVWVAYIHPDDLETARTALTTVVEVKEGKADFDLRIIRPDEEVRHLHFWAQRIEADHDHPPVLLGTVADITPTA